MNDPSKVSPDEAHALMTNEGFVYVDVRTPEEFVEGHPEGAVNVPSMRRADGGLEPVPDFVEHVAARFDRASPLIVGCKMGGRSARAAKLLVEAGFTRVVDQRAGWDGTRGTFGELIEPGWSRTSLPRSEG